MRDYLKQKIKDELEKLSLDRREAVNSFNWEELSQDIGKKSGLTDEEIEQLQLEIGLVLVGLANINDFDYNLSEQVNLQAAISQKIAIAVFNNIFEPISNKIKIEPDLLINKNTDNIYISNTITKKIYDIAQKYKLPIDKMGKVEEFTNRFLNGEISSTQYENELSLTTDLPPTQIEEMVKDINENIVKNTREEMKEGISNKQYVVSNKESTNNIEEIDVPPKPPVVETEKNKESIPVNLPIMENSEKNKKPELGIEEMPLELEEGEDIPLPPKKEVKIKNEELEIKKETPKPDINQQIESIIKDSRIKPIQQIPPNNKQNNSSENKIETQAKIFKDSGIEILPQDEIPTKKIEVPEPKITNNLQNQSHKHDPYREEI